HPPGLPPSGARSGGLPAVLLRRRCRPARLPRRARRRCAAHSRASAGECAVSLRHRRGGPPRRAPREPASGARRGRARRGGGRARRPGRGGGPPARGSPLAHLKPQARPELPAQGGEAARVRVVRLLELRAGDSDITLSVPLAPLEEVRRRLHADHLRRFGFVAHTLAVVIEALRVEARLASVDAATLTI